MRKLTLKFNQWWFRTVIHPYLMKHGPECCAHLRNVIVYQMWYSKINFTNINRWLTTMKEPTIKEYTMEGPKGNRLRLFYEVLTPEQRKQITTPIFKVIQEN